MNKGALQTKSSQRVWLMLPAALALAGLGLILGVVQSVQADVAPIAAQAGTGFGAAASTNIQMISETVLLTVVPFPLIEDNPNPAAQLGAHVVADFALLNPDSSIQHVLVGFPLEVPGRSAAGRPFIQLSKLQAFVEGSAAQTQLMSIGAETWSAWQMGFAPGVNQVRVTYDLPATVDACNAELGYVLHTGAAWAGSIGQADLIVRYPYAAEATFLSPHGIYLGDTTAGSQAAGNDLRWHYDNLEPTKANDLAVTFVSPTCWLPVAAARTALNANATAQNYWHLANAYADIVLFSHSFYSPLIAQVADAQFQKALALDPRNPQINSDYAQFLVFMVGYLIPANRQPDEIKQCLTAIALAPSDDVAQNDCRPFLAGLVGDHTVSPEIQATVAAALDAEPAATEQDLATKTSSATTRPGGTVTPAPTVTTRPSATVKAVAASPTLPAQVRASSTPLVIAQAESATSPSPTAPAAAATQEEPDISALVIVLAVLLVVGLAVFVRRRRKR